MMINIMMVKSFGLYVKQLFYFIYPYLETSQLIFKANQLTGFYMRQDFTERCFQRDYSIPFVMLLCRLF